MNRDILAVIQENLHTFSKGQKKIANFILESYDKAAFMTASRLGKRVGVSDMEFTRPGKSYTADTLEQLHAQYPGAELWLLMGTDMFLTVHTWREPEVITRLAGVCTFARTSADSVETLNAQAERLQRELGARTRVLQLPQVVDVSSTQLRELLARGEGQQYLPPAAEYFRDFIIRSGEVFTQFIQKSGLPDLP